MANEADEKMANIESEEKTLSAHYSRQPSDFEALLESSYSPEDPRTKELNEVLREKGIKNF